MLRLCGHARAEQGALVTGVPEVQPQQAEKRSRCASLPRVPPSLPRVPSRASLCHAWHKILSGDKLYCPANGAKGAQREKTANVPCPTRRTGGAAGKPRRVACLRLRCWGVRCWRAEPSRPRSLSEHRKAADVYGPTKLVPAFPRHLAEPGREGDIVWALVSPGALSLAVDS